MTDDELSALRSASSGESLYTHTHIAGIPALSILAHIDAQATHIRLLEDDVDRQQAIIVTLTAQRNERDERVILLYKRIAELEGSKGDTR